MACAFSRSSALFALWLAVPCSTVSQFAGGVGYVLNSTLLTSLPKVERAAQYDLAPLKTARRAAAFLQQRAALSGPDDTEAASRTLQNLDANGDGKIDRSEIAIFAQGQGLDAASAANELALSDTDGDGALNARELSFMLGGQVVAEVAPPTRQMPVIPVTQPAAVRAAPIAAASTAYAEQLPSTFQARPQPGLVSVAGAAASAISAGVAQTSGSSAQAGSSAAYALSSIVAQRSAQSAANTFVEQLALEAKEEKEAQDLEQLAAELRANSTALSKRMIQSALAAGSRAATAKAQEVLGNILHLEADETKKEVAAAALRAKAKDELREANELMSIADSALKPEFPAGV